MMIKLINSYFAFFIFLFNMTMIFQICVFIQEYIKSFFFNTCVKNVFNICQQLKCVLKKEKLKQDYTNTYAIYTKRKIL